MNYYLISLTNQCNKNCSYCTVKQFVNNKDYPDKMSCVALVNWLEPLLQKDDVVELTGGEPTMIGSLLFLLDFLKDKNTKVILRTNGYDLRDWRKDYPNMFVILASHNSSEDYINKRKAEALLPKDVILDCSEFKTNNESSEGKRASFHKELGTYYPIHKFVKMFYVTADGKVQACPAYCEGNRSDDFGAFGTVWEFRPILTYLCPDCHYACGAYSVLKNFL